MLATSVDSILLYGLKMRDLTAIFGTLKEILAHGTLSLWHCKVVYERTAKIALVHRQLVVVPTAAAKSNSKAQLVCPPMPTTQTAHPPLLRKKRRKDRVSSDSGCHLRYTQRLRFLPCRATSPKLCVPCRWLINLPTSICASLAYPSTGPTSAVNDSMVTPNMTGGSTMT